MANTNTLRTLNGTSTSKLVTRSVHIVSDGTEETDLVVYDNSAFIANTAKGKVTRIWISGSWTGAVRLEWDQTADSPIASFGKGDSGYRDYRSFGGISNPNGAGATGDIVLTTTALANLDEISLIIEIDQS